MTLEDLALRVARLEQHQDLATRADLAAMRADTKADLAAVRIELSRDIANLATGIRQDLTTIRGDLAAIHTDLGEIRRLLERRTFRWPWERA